MENRIEITEENKYAAGIALTAIKKLQTDHLFGVIGQLADDGLRFPQRPQGTVSDEQVSIEQQAIAGLFILIKMTSETAKTIVAAKRDIALIEER